jgi:hypothetical protein
MCYYTYELDEESANLCVMVTHFRKFCYLCLLMELSHDPPNFAQDIIKEEVFGGMDECKAYINDVGGTFNDDWASHLKSPNQVLQCLEANSFKVNPLKCEWAMQETDWLG